MLQRLQIRDFVIVDQVALDFSTGFTVFSGETGAGKSILVDALSLLLGARGEASMVRPGSKRADFSAIFQPSARVQHWLQTHSLDADDELILRRTIEAQGRSRAFINGHPVTLTQLKDIGELLVDIHGQHAHQSLLKTSHQRRLLDDQVGKPKLLQSVQQAWDNWQQALQTLSEAKAAAASQQQEQERLQWQLSELHALELAPDEWEALTRRHSRLAHAQALIEGCARALEALDGNDVSASTLLHQASSELQQLSQHDAALENIVRTLESAVVSCRDAVSDVNQYASTLELDADALETAEARMAQLFNAARKFHLEPDALATRQQELEQQLHELQAHTNVQALQEAADRHKQHYLDQARQLSEHRQQTAKSLRQDVSQAMQTLAMKGGAFEIRIHPAAPGRHGMDAVEFLVAGHSGTAPQPLAKVASGGELARISLALSVIASQAARVPTLIFDEVDTGIGGAVAEVVGQLLKALGKRHQVLCVTHLPQVAACGNQHFLVHRHTENSVTRSEVYPLSDQARLEEIARMLGGSKITQTTRNHAQEMLALNTD